MQKFISIKSFLIMFALVLTMSPLQTMHVSASTANTSNDAAVTPLEIEPDCSDAVAGQAHWKVTNKNAQPVNIHWTNLDNDVEGDYIANDGESTMLTSYEASEPNNRTEFEIIGLDTTSTNATKEACEPVVTPPPPTDCVDGHTQQNVVVNFLDKNTVQIGSKDNKPFCEDQDIYFSSYIMPSTYDGNGFNNTAYPQTKHSSTHKLFEKNMPVAEVMTIDLPDECNNTQVDVYYAPEITMVDSGGHGTQNIVSAIYPSTGPCDSGQGGNGGSGSGSGSPTTPTVQPSASNGQGAGNPVVAAAPAATVPMPKELPKTGSNLLAMLLILPILVAVISYFMAAEYQKRRYLRNGIYS